MAGNVPYDLDGDGRIGAYEMTLYDEDQAKASSWQARFADGLNDQLAEACEAAEHILADFAKITGSDDKTLPMKLIYHELMKGIIEKHLWNQTICEPAYVFLDQNEFYPDRILLNNFHRYFPAPCGLAEIESNLSSGTVLFRSEADLSAAYCGNAWKLIVDSLAKKEETEAENAFIDLANEAAQLCYAFLPEIHFDTQFTYANELSDLLSEQWERLQEK